MPIANPTQYKEMLANAKDQHFALPSINCYDLESVNAAISGFIASGSDGIIQFSTGGAEHASGFMKDGVQGAVELAEYAHKLANHPSCNVMVAVHTDHCTKDKLPGFLEPLLNIADSRRRAGFPQLFNCHMFDGGELDMTENLSMTEALLKRCSANGIALEMELGVVGGAEDGAAESKGKKNYTTPDDMLAVHERFKDNPGLLLVAATFGNVHGYSPKGSEVVLSPEILAAGQQLIAERYGITNALNLVFHGGSGSPKEKILQSLDSGIIKMNIDTDTQIAFMRGLATRLQSQMDGLFSDAPPKDAVDPRKYLKSAMTDMSARVEIAAQDLRSANRSAYAAFEERGDFSSKWTDIAARTPRAIGM